MQMLHLHAVYTTLFSSQFDINRLFAYCNGGNFNFHIWARFGYFIC